MWQSPISASGSELQLDNRVSEFQLEHLLLSARAMCRVSVSVSASELDLVRPDFR